MTGKKNKEQPSPRPGSKSLYIWIGLVFFVSAWMFVLGILVGRGTAPIRVDMQKLQKELAALKDAMVQKEQTRFKIDLDAAKDATNLGFHEALRATKEDSRSSADASAPKSKPMPEKPAPADAPKPRSNGLPTASDKNGQADKPLTIQVASVKDAALADQMVAKLKKMGYPAYRSIGNIQGKGVWYRVRVGSFGDKNEATGTLNSLKKDNLSAILVPR